MCGALRIYFSLTRGLIKKKLHLQCIYSLYLILHIDVLLLGQNVEKKNHNGSHGQIFIIIYNIS